MRSRNAAGGSAPTLAVIGAGSVLASLDLFVVNLAFSSISANFPQASAQTRSWVLNAYSVLFAALLIPSGRLADRFGRKRLFRLGLGVFAVGSALSAGAPNIAMLVAGRGIQGAGAALLVPTSLALLLAAYPKERHQQMVGIWAATGSVASAAGPVVGGLLVELDWRWVFVINLPIAIPALLASRRLVETPRPSTRIPDLFGSALLVVSVSALVTAISYAGQWGPASLALWASLGITAVAFAWFVHRCATSSAPAIELAVFRSGSFSAATIGMACFYIAFAIMLLGGSLFLIHVWRWHPLLAGIGLAAGPATAIIGELAAGNAPIAPPRLAALGGLMFLAAGILWLFALGEASDYAAFFLPGMILTGAGAGVAQTGFLTSATARLPADQHATGTGIVNSSRQIGAAVGVALLTALTGAGACAADYRAAWAVMGIAGFVAAASALVVRDRSAAIGREPLSARDSLPQEPCAATADWVKALPVPGQKR